MEIKLPENPNIYFIGLGAMIIIFGFLIVLYLLESFASRMLVMIIFIIAGNILFFIGISGLKKTHDLKNEKIQEEINLLKAQQTRTILGPPGKLL